MFGNNNFSNNSGEYNKFETIPVSSHEDSARISEYITKVYSWMFVGLVITAGMAYFTATTPAIMNFLIKNTMLSFGLMIGELILVGYLVLRIHKMSTTTATALFLAYAAINGLFFSFILMVYTAGSIATTFAITAGTFGVMSFVGYTTKTDLTSLGKLLMMALVGIIIASIVNFFLKSSGLYWIISYIGVAVFVGLIAYDTQKIKAYALLEDEDARKKGAIMGALALYLDFINLFLMLLRLFGKRD